MHNTWHPMITKLSNKQENMIIMGRIINTINHIDPELAQVLELVQKDNKRVIKIVFNV